MTARDDDVVTASDEKGGAGQSFDPPTAPPRHPLVRIAGDQLTADTAQSPGMSRLEAISGKSVGAEHIWMGRTRVAPGARSADHHHGASETAIHVVSGHPAFVFRLDGREVRIETEPGDFVWVPPFTPHREENPDPDEEAVVVIARSTQEPIVVNLPGLGP
ncbi:MAG TPA: cupin domain-containing protein [Acidimicrobiales bacterium]|nr:cupin domain-containing protein [Acidimicrobiales bacterium]